MCVTGPAYNGICKDKYNGICKDNFHKSCDLKDIWYDFLRGTYIKNSKKRDISCCQRIGFDWQIYTKH